MYKTRKICTCACFHGQQQGIHHVHNQTITCVCVLAFMCKQIHRYTCPHCYICVYIYCCSHIHAYILTHMRPIYTSPMRYALYLTLQRCFEYRIALLHCIAISTPGCIWYPDGWSHCLIHEAQRFNAHKKCGISFRVTPLTRGNQMIAPTLLEHPWWKLIGPW